MKCKNCIYFSNLGTCSNPEVPFPIVKKDGSSDCILLRSKLHCRDCNYWREAKGTTREDNCGGCTYGGRFFPMFLDETCGLNEENRINVEIEHGIL
jgi:hypothetical protein